MYKIIKTTEFTANSEPHVNYMVAFKGRVFKVSTLTFDRSEITVNGNTLTVKGSVELRKESYTDSLGQLQTGLQLMPKLDIALADV